jgi:ferric-dicitrate binding protein FerR (iron transport regulator)
LFQYGLQFVFRIEGKVQVDLPEAMMRISSGEHVIINKISDSYSKEKDIMEKFAIWRTGGIRFNSTPIQDVAKELERIYHCKVIFSGNKPYDNRIVTHLQFNLAFKRFQLALIISDKTT